MPKSNFLSPLFEDYKALGEEFRRVKEKKFEK